MKAIPVLEVSHGAYLISISRMTAAEDLHAIKREILADRDLNPLEMSQLLVAINKKFGQLNHAAIGKQTPRWN